MPNEQSEKQRLVLWSRRMNVIRDILLVGASVLYILGYIVWAINALSNNLGLLPALESQYFVAGFIPFVLFALVFLYVKLITYLKRRIHDLLFEGSGPKKRVLWASLIFGILIICFIVIYTLTFLWHAKNTQYFRNPYIIGALILFSIDFYLFPKPELRDPVIKRLVRIYNCIGAVVLYSLVLFLLSWGLILFLNVFYPCLPQEYGGAKPRLAYIDLQKDSLSQETLTNLTPTDYPESNGDIIRTKKVCVYFSGNEFLLVKPYSVKACKQDLLEIKKDVVKAIVWCKDQ